MDEIKSLISRLMTGAKTLNKKLVLALAGVAALSAFVLNNSITASSIESKLPVASASSGDQASASVQTQSGDSTIKKPQVFVHLVGEVLTPGIYSVDSGSRVVDVLILAGGFTKKADQTSINLARPLSDGEQILVLRLGAQNAMGTSGSNSSGFASQSGGSLINLNRGSLSELEQLPGVGPTLAQRIIDWRAANGGFKSKLDLQNIAGIGDKMFAAIEPKVTL